MTGYLKLFLRLAVAAGFLSAVADRFGYWPASVTVWGSWQKFVEYTGIINPWLPSGMVPAAAAVATVAEIILALMLIAGYKTENAARLSGFLMLTFGLAMTFSTGLKGALDYSVFSAAGAAFGLSLIKEKFLEIDSLLK
ncbi:MAG: DoxX family protein [Cyclobacteriaceae bacterium]|nr:DoxX family protein [Cyclobacteriaceae bacterium]